MTGIPLIPLLLVTVTERLLRTTQNTPVLYRLIVNGAKHLIAFPCWGHSLGSYVRVIQGPFVGVIRQGHLSRSFMGTFIKSFVGVIHQGHSAGPSLGSFLGVICWRKFQKYQTVWECHYHGIIRGTQLKSMFQAFSGTNHLQATAIIHSLSVDK